jgi:hypothetical protein
VRCERRSLRAWCAATAMLALAVVPLELWLVPSPLAGWGHHGRAWWVANTPVCLPGGVVCLNVFDRYTSIEVHLPW